MAFIRKLPDVPERLEHLKGGAGHLDRYAILSPEEMLGAGYGLRPHGAAARLRSRRAYPPRQL